MLLRSVVDICIQVGGPLAGVRVLTRLCALLGPPWLSERAYRLLRCPPLPLPGSSRDQHGTGDGDEQQTSSTAPRTKKVSATEHS
jgi:hypothetical protein